MANMTKAKEANLLGLMPGRLVRKLARGKKPIRLMPGMLIAYGGRRYLVTVINAIAGDPITISGAWLGRRDS